ncbi:MAG: hypothetical protein HY930_05790, partial [Euryarchaeota archaeon]|nr:hypothetical protein [Euryarchaeota archaeon]
ADLRSITKSKDELDSEIAILRTELEGKGEKLSETLSFLKSEQDRAARLESQLVEFKEKYQNLQLAFEEKSKEIKTSQLQVPRLESEIARLSKFEKENVELRKEVAKLKEALSETRDVGELKKIIDEKTRDIKAGELQVQKLRAEIERFSKFEYENLELKREIENLNRTLLSTKKELMETQDKFADLRSITKSKDELDSEIAILRTELEGKGEKLSETLSFLKSEQDRAARLESQLVEFKEKYQNLQLAFEDVSKEVKTLQLQVQKLEGDLRQKNELISAKASAVEKLTENSGALKTEVDILKESIFERDIKLSGYEEKISTLNDRIEKLQEEVNSKDEAVKAKERTAFEELRNLQLQIQKLREDATQKDKLIAETEKLKASLSERDGKISSLEAALRDLDGKLRLQEETIKAKEAIVLEKDLKIKAVGEELQAQKDKNIYFNIGMVIRKYLIDSFTLTTAGGEIIGSTSKTPQEDAAQARALWSQMKVEEGEISRIEIVGREAKYLLFIPHGSTHVLSLLKSEKKISGEMLDAMAEDLKAALGLLF